MTDEISISKFEDEGIYVLMAEGASQGPIILETEGPYSSREAAQARLRKMSWITRYCVCRVVPVSGNELLPLDMERMQK